MKKTLKSAFVVTACLGVSIVLGCSDKDKDVSPETCSESLGKVLDLLTDKVVKEDKKSCEAYKAGVRDYLKNCSAEISNGTKRDYERQLDEPCPN
ncbi:hypothetical protein [Persicitalea jodogahamensis]|nr:hypothetical protein [Persicitalea jodogahamensis]